MAATSNTPTPERKPAATRRTTTARKTTARKATGTSRRTTTAARRRAATTTSTQPRTPVAQVTELAERAVLVPVGASLIVSEDLVSTVKGLATKYRTRAGIERELKRFERRGSTARNRFERQVRRQRTKFERELRQRRASVERTVKQNRRRLEREVRTARRDLQKQSGVVGARFEKLVSEAQELLSSTV